MTDSCPALPTRCSGDQYSFISVAHAGLSLQDLRNLAVADAYHGSARCSQSRVSSDVPRFSCATPPCCEIQGPFAAPTRGKLSDCLQQLEIFGLQSAVHDQVFR